jgi:hypothetical protein
MKQRTSVTLTVLCALVVASSSTINAAEVKKSNVYLMNKEFGSVGANPAEEHFTQSVIACLESHLGKYEFSLISNRRVATQKLFFVPTISKVDGSVCGVLYSVNEEKDGEQRVGYFSFDHQSPDAQWVAERLASKLKQ